MNTDIIVSLINGFGPLVSVLMVGGIAAVVFIKITSTKKTDVTTSDNTIKPAIVAGADAVKTNEPLKEAENAKIDEAVKVLTDTVDNQVDRIEKLKKSGAIISRKKKGT